MWPQASDGTVSLTRAQLSMLLKGIDWRVRYVLYSDSWRSEYIYSFTDFCALHS